MVGLIVALCGCVQGIDDAAGFQAVSAAMAAIGIEETERTAYFRVVAAGKPQSCMLSV